MLGQDGTFYPFSRNGLVKWKQSATGRIEEKPFGDFPVSLLPGGTYNFYFMLTTAGSLDAYYLWSTYFSAPETSGTVPDGSAGFFNGTLVVPNATIIYQGQEYQGSAPIPPDTLVGIIRDGKTYLYHTDLGKTVVSDETTRRAVGRFVMGPATGEVQSRTARAGFAPNSDNTLKVSTSSTLKTGVELQRQAAKEIKATNNQRRWAAVKATDGSGPYFLPPVHRYVDNNLIRLLGTHLKLDKSWFNASENHELTFYPSSDSLIIETYGAAWRPIAYFLDGSISIGDIVSEYFSGQSPPAPDVVIPIDGLDLREQKDAALGVALDRIDLAYMLFEGVKTLYATADITECKEGFVNLACNLAIAITHVWYSSETGSPNAWSSIRSAFEDAANDLLNVGIVLGTGGATIPFLTLVDGLAALNYLIEGVVIHEADVVGRWAYDEIRLEPENSSVIGIWNWIDDKNCSNTHEFKEEGNFSMKLYGPEKNNAATMTPFGDGNWTLLGNTLEIMVRDIQGREYTFVGIVTDECQKVTGEYRETSNYPVDEKKHCWYAIRIR